MSVRPAAVAGAFYPASKDELQRQVNAFIDEHHSQTAAAPTMLIVPHAGYVYSGHIAASAYTLLKEHRHAYRRVVLIGPSHRVPLQGIATSSAQRFNTPVGSVELDTDAQSQLMRIPAVQQRDDAHMMEHSLEVQLPFLQSLLSDFRLIPLVVGAVEPEAVSEVLKVLLTPQTLIVVSTDLSHFHSDTEARAIDSSTIAKILNGQLNINGNEACGHYPLAGALLFAQMKGWHIQLQSHGNSSDTIGDRSRVVGYASFSFTAEKAA